MSEMPKEEIEELMVQLERYVKKNWMPRIEEKKRKYF